MMTLFGTKSTDIEQILLSIIDTAIGISEADFGNIQLIDLKTGNLKIVAQRGFPQDWLDYWDTVTHEWGCCGNALKNSQRIVVEDICASPLFTKEDVEMQLKVGVRAVQSTPLLNRAGNIIGMFSTHYKTPHVVGERSHRLLDLLAKQISDSIYLIELQIALSNREEELKKAVTVREDFISMLSHELNTPLTTMKIVTQVGSKLRERGKLTAPDIDKLFASWSEQLDTFEALIGSLLDTTAIRQSRLKFASQEVDLNEVVLKVIRQFPGQILYQSRSLHGYWDPYRFEQIVTNLITNAIKYGNGHPVRVALHEAADKNFILTVKDQGVGISEKDLGKIFNKFERGVSEKTIMGMGLGLYIVKHIVELQDGDIQVESKPGKGSTFTVTLPLQSACFA